MSKIIHWWASNHVAANLLMIVIFFAGIMGFNSMEREMFPTFPYPGLQITVIWPGAGPQEVEEQIVDRVEEVLKDVQGVSYTESVSRESVGEIRLFAESSADFSRLIDDVKARVDGIAGLPSDVENINIYHFDTKMEIIRVVLHGDIGEKRLSSMARDLQQELRAVDHVSEVQLFGTRREEVAIEVSETALRRYNLSFQEIANAIRMHSINLSAGNLRTDAGTYSLSARLLADSEEEFNAIVVRQSQSGTVTVGDLATVTDGFEEDEVLATMNGEPAVLLQVMSSEDMDIVNTSDSVTEWVEARKKRLPPGVGLSIWTDWSDPFRSRMATISKAALGGLLLVFVVLFLTLRPMVAIWVSIGIATAFAGAFVFLKSVDASINMLSTFAFLLVLGIIVDDAIIVGERVHSEFEQGHTGIDGAARGASAVYTPVIFGVLTTIIAFLPWLLIEGPIQQITRQISWVVVLALTFSLIEALLILPAHLSTMKPKQKDGRISRLQHRVANTIVNFGNNRYGPQLQKAIAHPWLTASIFVGALVVGFGGLQAGNYVKTSFMPEVESEQIYINIDLRDGTTYERALEILEQMQAAQEQLRAEVEQEGVEGKNQVVEDWYTRSRRDSVIAIVKLASPEVRSMPAKDAALRLRQLIGDVAEARAIQVEYSLGSGGPDLQLAVRHKDLQTLEQAVEELSDKLMEFPALYDVLNSFESANEEIRFTLKPGAEQMGLTVAGVMQQVRQAYYGEEAQRLPRDGQDVRVMVRYDRQLRRSPESLNTLRIRTADGREVPLTSVVNIHYAPGLNKIDHRDGNRSVQVSAYLSEPVRGEIMEALESDFFPRWENKYFGIEYGAVGDAEEEEEFMQEMTRLLSMALLAMYCMLAVAFKSYSQPILILIAIPFAALGGLIGHFLFQMSLSLYSYLGIVAAAGVVVNDNLVLIDYYNRLREQGQDYLQAIVNAGKSRFRPILVTTLTTFVGLVPLMLERSTQAAFLKPVVVSLSFGVILAFFVTLFLVPAMLVIGARYTGWRRSLFKRDEAPISGTQVIR